MDRAPRVRAADVSAAGTVCVEDTGTAQITSTGQASANGTSPSITIV